MTTVFAIDDHTAEWHQEQCGERLRDDEQPEELFRVRGLKDVPVHGRDVHSAAEHRYEISGKE